MADITMCADVECPSREKCFRFTAVKSDHQTFADFTSLRNGESKCRSFWDNSAYRPYPRTSCESSSYQTPK